MLDISLLLLWHMLVGFVVVFTGMVALLLRKGSIPHKLAGRIFVVAMIFMGPVVAAEVFFSSEKISSLGILFVFFIIYLVISGWPTKTMPQHKLLTINIFVPLLALCISLAGLVMGFDKLVEPATGENIPPVGAYFFFASIAFVAMLLDINNLRKGAVMGKHRLVRHVWRMSGALFFATSSLFTGPGSVVFSNSIRGNPILSIPQFLVVILALFWIYRLLFSKQPSFSNILIKAIESKGSTPL